MGELCEYVDVCIANEEDAADVFRNPCIQYRRYHLSKVNKEGYKDVAKQLADPIWL